MRLIDEDALIDALMTYTWRDEDERLIDDADEKRAYIKEWLPVLPTVGGWISVKDRLPEKNGYYLGYTCDGIIWLYIFTANSGVFDDALGFATDTVTHWMPLPEPQKEDGDAD